MASPSFRVGLNVLVRIRVPEGHPHLAHAQDVSLSGMLIESEEAFDVGADVLLTFFPPGKGDPIEIQGMIARRDGNDHGVHFIHEPPAELINLLAVRTPRTA